MTDVTRPPGLLPGTREFFHEVTATKARRFLDQVLDHADPTSPNPSTLRAVALVMERTDPTVSSVHHTVETKTSKLTTEQLKAKLQEILSRDAQVIECRDIEPIDYADIVEEQMQVTETDSQDD